MEKDSGKQIIFRIGEIGNSESRGWIPYSKALKKCILDYLSKEYARPANRATSANEVFSILADWDNFYRERNELDDEGYFFKTHKELLDDWGITRDVITSSTDILSSMGWIDKKIIDEYRNGHPQKTPYYRINHEKIIKDIQKKYPNTYKLF